MRNTTFENVLTTESGIIAWRYGTGGNVELTYLLVKSEVRRDGQGRALFRAMLDELRKSPPYATVYGFTRSGNSVSQDFYRSLGFFLTPVVGVYDDGCAIVFSARYADLLAQHFPQESS